MKKVLILAFTLVLALGMLAVFGCSPHKTAEEEVATTTNGEPPVIPSDHVGRYDGNGSTDCYQCHGSDGKNNPSLSTSVALPENHYKDGNVDSLELDPLREQCILCHAQS